MPARQSDAEVTDRVTKVGLESLRAEVDGVESLRARASGVELRRAVLAAGVRGIPSNPSDLDDGHGVL